MAVENIENVKKVAGLTVSMFSTAKIPTPLQLYTAKNRMPLPS